MGSSCSNSDDQRNQRSNRRSKRYNDDDDEKESNLLLSNRAEQSAMEQEVILLSTRNANLEQEAEELKKTQSKCRKYMKQEMLTDILVYCQCLNINAYEVLFEQKELLNSRSNSSDSILNVLEIDTNKTDSIRRIIDSFNRNKQFYALLYYLEEAQQIDAIKQIVCCQVFKTYYRSNKGKLKEDEQEMAEIYDFCVNELKLSSQTVAAFQNIIKEENNIHAQYKAQITYKN